MTKTILRRHHRDEAAIPVAKATAAPHLSSRQDRDRVVSFDDFDPEADFTGMPHDWQPARGADELDHAATRDALDELLRTDLDVVHTIRTVHDVSGRRVPVTIPDGALRVVPLLDDMDVVVADITQLVADGAYVCLPLRIRLEWIAAMLGPAVAS